MATAGHSGYASVNGVELYYEIHGAGEPLVMLHGGVNPAEMFGVLLPEMAKAYQVIAVHLQGHGNTEDIDRPFSFEAMADDVAGLLAHLGLARVSVMGYSLGAGVAVQAAIRHAEVVRSVIAISIPFSTAGFYPEVQATFEQMPLKADVIAAHMSKSPLGARYPRVKWATLFTKLGVLNSAPRDWSADIVRMTAPALLVFADADAVSTAHVAEFYRLLGGGLQDAGQDGSGRASLSGILCVGHTMRSVHAPKTEVVHV